MLKKEHYKRLPRNPGVYLMKNASGEILYVGKAVDLRRRVASHFRVGGRARTPAAAKATLAETVDFIVTDTEQEALLLEQTLVREHRPPYNIRLKDDSSPAHIRLSLGDDYPCLSVTRNVARDGARYFGPYYSAASARETIRFLQRVFPLRACSMQEFSHRARPCIKYQIRRCAGPCRGLIGKGEYDELVGRVILFLSGETGDLIALLKSEMEKQAAGLDFEKAAKTRDTLGAIARTVERQKSVSLDLADRDAVGIYWEQGEGEAAILFVRGGKLVGSTTFALEGGPGDEGESIRGILTGHYCSGAFVPPEILLPALPDDHPALARLLRETRAGAVALIAPRRGDRRALVRMAASNAAAAFHARRESDLEWARVAKALKTKFLLPVPPEVIESVDISDIGGAAAVGSVVAFRRGAPDRDRYRRFSIKTVSGSDDCRKIHEVVSRRTRRGRSGWGIPDLIVVDGGRGQLQAACRAVRESGLTTTGVIALAKGRPGEEGRTAERVFIPGRRNPIALRPGDAITLFLQRIRDEAHRFALAGHRRMRRERLLGSEFERLRGVGLKRRARLIAAFGDIRGAAAATQGELTRVLGSEAAARSVYDYFHRAVTALHPSGV